MKNNIKRIYVCKKDEFDHDSKALREEIKSSLGIDALSLKKYRRYDVEISDKTLEETISNVFYEPPVEEIYCEDYKRLEESFYKTI